MWVIIPAAGHSRRMGQPKLLLPVGERTVIECVISTVARYAPQRIVVVARRSDTALQQEVRRCQSAVSIPVDLLTPAIDPPDMRASVEAALEQIAITDQPPDEAGWLLIPADHPMLVHNVVEQLLTVGRLHRDEIVVPTFQGRRGHPTLFPWSAVAALHSLPSDVGVNGLLRDPSVQVRNVVSESEWVLRDLDHPEDYQRWLAELASASSD